MRREHRTHQAVRQDGRDGVGVQSGGVQPLDGEPNRAGAVRAVGATTPAALVNVLGDVGEEREERRGADHDQRVGVGQPVEMGGELRRPGACAAGVDRPQTRALHQLQDPRARLLADHLTQDAAEQSNVVAEGGVVSGVCRRRVRESHASAGPESYLWGCTSSRPARRAGGWIAPTVRVDCRP